MFFQRIKHWLELKRSDLQARIAKHLVQREVVKVLRLAHAQELVDAPRAEWSLIKKHQSLEIQAVRDGSQFDIVDRRSWAYPYLPEALHRLNQPVLKNTPYNLRRFSETPIPRRAINLIKNGVLSRSWQLEPFEKDEQMDEDLEQRIQIGTEMFKRPNNVDSFREFLEAIVEDLVIGGYGCIEPRYTPFAERPLKMWPVDGSTIRIFLDWTESTPDRPKYAQMTGLKGERGIVTFLDDELIYIRDNVRTSTPFGMGKLEVAFNSVNAFLGVQDMSARAGADQVHKTWLWWEQSINPGHIQTVRRHILNELEGQSKISLMAGAKLPTVLDVQAVRPEDLLLDWQRFLIDIIAAAFDMSPLALGQTDKVNKATGQVMAESDFLSSVVPVAKRIEEQFTRRILQGRLGWKDIQFRFIGLEDPDAVTRTMIQQRQYMMNAITPNEVREANGLAKLPGKWGDLVSGQQQILLVKAQAVLGAKGAPGSGGGAPGGAGAPGGGAKMGPGASGMGGGGGTGTGAGTGMSFSAYDIAQMQPQEIEIMQELGMLPPGAQLPQQMEQEAPGILTQLSEELKQFFDYLQVTEDESEIQPRPITTADEKAQMVKWQESEHQESLAEKTINRRGNFGPAIDQQVTKNPERGKYPRSGGRYVDPKKDETRRQKRYSPGKDNPYQ